MAVGPTAARGLRLSSPDLSRSFFPASSLFSPTIARAQKEAPLANPEHLRLLKQGVDAWNQWRAEHLDIDPDLSGANLGEANLRGANLSRSHLTGARFFGANASAANFSETNFWGANLQAIDLRGANLRKADLRMARLRKFSGAAPNGHSGGPSLCAGEGRGADSIQFMAKTSLVLVRRTERHRNEAGRVRCKVTSTFFKIPGCILLKCVP